MDIEDLITFVQNEDKKHLKLSLDNGLPIDAFYEVNTEYLTKQLTLLSTAVINNKYDMCQFLLEEGANVNIQDEIGFTSCSGQQ